MKATKAGSIIGTAMTTFSGDGVGEVIAFVKNGSTSGAKIADIIPNLTNANGQQVLDNLMTNSNGRSDSSEVTTDRLTAAAEVITPKITVDTIQATKLIDPFGKILDIEDLISGIFRNATEFLAKVIFHTDVSFLGHLAFGQDSTGHAIIKAGDTEVEVNFQNAYKNTPVVNVNANLTGGVPIDQIPQFSLYDVAETGFKIKLAHPVSFDIDFGWITVGTSGETTATSISSPATALPEVTPEPQETALPTPTPNPTQTPVSSPEVHETPTPFATLTPVETPSATGTSTPTPTMITTGLPP